LSRHKISKKYIALHLYHHSKYHLTTLYILFHSLSLVEAGYVSTADVQYTRNLEFFGEATSIIPAYQVLDMKGSIVDKKQDPNVTFSTNLFLFLIA
jgi:hypothetical protein